MKKLIYSFLTLSLISACGLKKPVEKNSFSTIDLNYLDKATDPKDDFFQFSNGTWIAKTTIPPTESRWGSFNELEQSNNKKLTQILEEASKSVSEKGSQNQLLGAYYASYMNMEVRNNQYATALKKDLGSIDQINRKDFIVGIISQHHRDAIGSLFSFGIGQDMKQVEINAAYLSQGGIGLPNKEYYSSENKKEILQKYQDHITKCFVLSGESPENSKQAAENVVQFEKKLASSMMAPA